jgi:RNA polymerase sigma factor (sigma-70 family)
MPTSPINEVIQYLRSTLLPDGADLTDGQLLECFVRRRDPAALEALVRRHGPMVWGVCRRILQNHHDAEDAFQATFLVLVRKAGSIRSGAKAGNWLYGVAHQTSLKARATRAKRKLREAQVTDMPEPAVAEQDAWSDLPAVLDQELSRLPEKYRTVIVLCELEGKTVREAARQLGLPQGTVASRLARARVMLAKRLARHGLAVSGGALAAVLSEKAASASVPGSVMASTIKAVTSVAAGQAVATGVISGTVGALTEGVIKAMLLNKLMKVTAVLLVFAALSGAAGLIYQMQAAETPQSQLVTDKKAQQGVDAPQKERAHKDEETIQGTWVLVKLDQLNVKPQDFKGTFKVVITGNKIIYPDNSQGKFRLDPTKEPKRFDLVVEKGGTAITVPGIYSLKGDELKYCHGREGDTEPPGSFDIKKAAPGTFPSCWTYRREKDDGQTNDLDKLQGTWRLVRSESDGLTFDEDRPEVKDSRLVIDKASVTMAGKLIHDPRIKKEPEDVKAVGTLTLDTKKNPKQIVFTWKTNPWLAKEDLVERGIYALDGDTLKLCFYFPGKDTRPLIPTEFSAKAGSKRNLGIWERVPPSGRGGEKKAQDGDNNPTSKDLSKIPPPGGVPLDMGRPGTEIKVDGVKQATKRLEAVPKEDLEKWVVELERIIDKKLKDGLPSARQTCRTDFVIHLSVAFDDLKWNAKAADNLLQRAQTMSPAEAKAWKEAFEALLRKKIGQTDTTIDAGGPAWAVPLVLIPVDALHEGQKYSAERGKMYVARLKQLTAADVSLWRDKVDKFGGTELDAAINIILLDDYFNKEKFQRDKFKAAVEGQQEKQKAPAKEAEIKDKLQGTWQIVAYETDGLRVGEGRPELKDKCLVIERDSFTLFYTPESDVSEAPTTGIKKATGTFTLDAKRTPPVILLTWNECPWNGKKDFMQKAIYALDGDSLKICLSRKDDGKEAPSEFSAKTGSERLLWTFKRVSTPEKEGQKNPAQQGQQGNKQKEKTSGGPAQKQDQAREGDPKGADLTKFDRTITKEPTYKSKPKYCLLVFGPQAKTRIWLVLDGDDLYVDRDANGDLTGKARKAERLPIPEPNKTQQVTSFLRHIPTPQGKITVEVTQTVFDRIRDNHYVSVWLEDGAEKPGCFERAGGSPEPTVFADRPQDAPILHFFGPRQTYLPYFPPPGPRLIRGSEGGGFYVTIGTPGLGKGSFVAHSHGGIPKDAHVVLDLEYPSKEAAGKKVHQRATLAKRC